MTVDESLKLFYQQSGFDIDTGDRPAFIDVFVGCLLIPLPNIETRRKYLKYHDLHHVLTGYGASQAGEGEVSAWELGTGSLLHPILMMMNLIAVSTGLAIAPVRVFKAYLSGCKSRNLYCPKIRNKIETGEYKNIDELRKEFLNCRCSDDFLVLKTIPFLVYAFLSLIIHALLVIPALLYKKVWGKFFKAKLVKVVKVRV
jgi:hypothetical protein